MSANEAVLRWQQLVAYAHAVAESDGRRRRVKGRRTEKGWVYVMRPAHGRREYGRWVKS